MGSGSSADNKHLHKLQQMLHVQAQRWSSFRHQKHKSLCGNGLTGSKPPKPQKHMVSKKYTARQSVKVNSGDRWGLNALHRAAQEGSLKGVQQCIAVGMDVNQKTNECLGCTPPLVFAASNGHAECVKALLEAGAQVNGADEWCNTALFKASCYNYKDCVKILLEFGADLNLANKWGALPLQYASLQGHDDIVQLLLQYSSTSGALKLSSSHGDASLPPPLIASATRCHLKCLKLLLQEGAESSQLESSLTMALYYFLCACAGYEYSTSQAPIVERFSCLELLIQHGAVIKPEHLKMACYHHFVPMLNLEFYVRMMTILLQSSSYDVSSSQWKVAMFIIFGHVTRLGPYKWDLVRLICSLGFTPDKDLLDSLHFTFTDEEYSTLLQMNSQPRKLSDLCRMTIRSGVQSNVMATTTSLDIPKLLKEIILVSSQSFYSI